MLIFASDATSPAAAGTSGAPEPFAGSGKNPDSRKVELDLEDAPFLAAAAPVAGVSLDAVVTADTPDTAEPAVPTPDDSEAGSSPRGRPLTTRHLFFAGGAGALLLLLALAVRVVLFGDGPAPQPAAVEEPVRTVVLPAEPTLPPAPAPADFLARWEPFQLAQRGPEGEIVFVYCSFSLPTDDAALYGELQSKQTTLRDAVYYYLMHRPPALLDNETKALALRADLAAVINDHLTTGRVEEVIIEQWQVRAP